VGIACAGTAFKDALDLLFPMLEDPIDFVRQGAFMSLALVLMQTSEARSPTGALIAFIDTYIYID
jgi:26S proteasome regulatory subunit N2